MDNKTDLEKIFDFFHEIESLKYKLRFGSSENKLNESVSAHSWRVAVMALFLPEKLDIKINILHAVKLALTHDLGEYISGDIDERIISSGKISKAEKKKLEMQAIEKLSETLPEIRLLWKEFEDCTSEEAKYAAAIDKLETLEHIINSGRETYNMPEMIPNYADAAVSKFPRLLPALLHLKEKLKKEFIKGGLPWTEIYDKIIFPVVCEQRQGRKH
jgi:putative hydrolase of HD superfamily